MVYFIFKYLPDYLLLEKKLKDANNGLNTSSLQLSHSYFTSRQKIGFCVLQGKGRRGDKAGLFQSRVNLWTSS